MSNKSKRNTQSFNPSYAKPTSPFSFGSNPLVVVGAIVTGLVTFLFAAYVFIGALSGVPQYGAVAAVVTPASLRTAWAHANSRLAHYHDPQQDTDLLMEAAFPAATPAGTPAGVAMSVIYCGLVARDPYNQPAFGATIAAPIVLPTTNSYTLADLTPAPAQTAGVANFGWQFTIAPVNTYKTASAVMYTASVQVGLLRSGEPLQSRTFVLRLTLTTAGQGQCAVLAAPQAAGPPNHTGYPVPTSGTNENDAVPAP